MSEMTPKERNTWWRKSMEKEQLRNTNRPRTKTRYSTPTNFSTFAPSPSKRRSRP